MKKSIFVALLFIGLGFQMSNASDSPEKPSIGSKNESILEKLKSNDLVKTSCKIIHDLAILYATRMISSTAHEYGHALFRHLLNGAQTHVVINVNDQTNHDEILNTLSEKLAKNGPGFFPSLHVNLNPFSKGDMYYAFYNLAHASTNKEIAIDSAGPLSGMLAAFLIKYIMPKPYYLKNISNHQIIHHALNLTPYKAFNGSGSDGYKIFKNLGFNVPVDSLRPILGTLELCNHAYLFLSPLISVGIKAIDKAIHDCM